jgi:hypothetical protein
MSVSIGKTHFIRFSFPPGSTDIASRGMRQQREHKVKYQSPKERYEIFLSIFPEPKNHIQHEGVRQEGIPAVWLNPFRIIF